MADTQNPFQSPQVFAAEVVAAPAGQFFIDGDCLVVPSGAIFPRRCVWTNEPLSERDRVSKTIYWTTPWIYLLIFLNLLILLIVYFVVRKKCQLTYYVSANIRTRKGAFTWLAVLAVLGSIVSIFTAIANESLVLLWMAGFLFLAALVFAVFASAPLRIKRHRDGLFWVKGFSPEYLQTMIDEGNVTAM